MSNLRLTITVDAAHVLETEAIAETLSHEGLHVDTVMPEVGAIFGTASDKVLAHIQSVKGVLEVRQSRGFQLPPMGEHIPQ